ncbi:phosphate ABC transporter permease subunit PstC [Tepidiforma bonchosmolovskayae]|uniref:Phosphate transport system permease protein n=1 Tax=Tepidiforma bonchosmolovskayae TaxID=2601677 RepID=A0ABX6C5I5_9CHLR|nr:phosphate ABC transporter permease subunit PstC [Tepidiforma bonchosmolovskayae]
MAGLFFVAATIGAFTTAGIILSLAGETIAFFRVVSFVEFITETQWTPLFSIKKFGIWPLVSATALTSLIALVVAVPLGLMSAIYLSEFAHPKARAVLKPALEVLAGVPTVVYGFFALTVMTPFLQRFIDMTLFNSLSPGIVMGVMIVPLVASLSEDAMSSVPQALREGAYGLGATRMEVATRVVVPAALSGIVASIILALSRAVGETMIVAIAAGQNPTFTFDPRVPVETMTTYIVQVSLGDTPYGSLAYRTLFAVGTTLFVLTFVMNIFSFWFVRKFREVYD